MLAFSAFGIFVIIVRFHVFQLSPIYLASEPTDRADLSAPDSFIKDNRVAQVDDASIGGDQSHTD